MKISKEAKIRDRGKGRYVNKGWEVFAGALSAADLSFQKAAAAVSPEPLPM